MPPTPRLRAKEEPSQPAVVKVSEFVAPEGPIELRADALLEWIEQEIDCDAAFVADEHGLAVVERNAETEFLAVSVALMSSLREVQLILPDVTPHMKLTLAPDQLVSFLLVDSQWGQFGVGVVSHQAPPTNVMNALANAVRSTFENDGSQE